MRVAKLESLEKFPRVFSLCFWRARRRALACWVWPRRTNGRPLIDEKSTVAGHLTARKTVQVALSAPNPLRSSAYVMFLLMESDAIIPFANTINWVNYFLF